MSIIVENGSGVANANSLVSTAFVTAYLSDRNRAAENGWTSPEGAEEEAACIAATDYVENRFGSRFKGIKQFNDISQAKGTLTFTVQPGSSSAVVIGSVTYRFVSAISVANDVLIGASVSESIDNLVSAINSDAASAGTAYHSGTAANGDVTAYAFYGDALIVYATASGTPGNAVATTTTVTGASWTATSLTGGSDTSKPQPLSFPRSGLYDPDGTALSGMPDALLRALAEYAARARSGSPLVADPTVGSTGGEVTKDLIKVGPITIDTGFSEGSGPPGLSKPYPEVDALLGPLLKSGNRVIRA